MAPGLKAANFLRVGRTAGRGRQDRWKRRDKTVKTVFMRSLDRHWRRHLGVRVVDVAAVLEPGEGLSASAWAGNEFGGAPLGDKRLSARLVKSADLLAGYPGHKINANSASDTTAISAFYRLIEMPSESAVTVANILAPHRERTICRMRGQTTVLAIQDGTDLNFTTRPGCDGLQVIGSNQTRATALGLHMHATLAVTETGLPLGVLRLGFDATAKRAPKAESRRKTERWLDAFADAGAAVREIGGKTRVISVCDREADCFEMFDAQRRTPRVAVLVRAKHDRVLGPGRAKLFATMSGGAPDDRVEIEIDGPVARPKSSRKKGTSGSSQAAGQLRVAVPACDPAGHGRHGRHGADSGVRRACRGDRTARGRGSGAVVPADQPRCQNRQDAADIVGFYLQRWKIEDWFRVLKSGCRVEHLLFRTADRLQRAVAINAVIAWRIMLMTLLGRQVPDCDPDLMFTDAELAFLHDYALAFGLAEPQRLGDAVALVAHLGGHRNRKHDPDPGNQIMWHGQTRMTSATLGHQIAHQATEIRTSRQTT